MSINNRVVLSLHGIKTRGVWQKALAPELAKAGFIPYVLDYGNFGALQLLLSSNLEKQVGWLVDEYDRIRAETGCVRPSVIAHSFGTLQVAHLLKMHRHVVFDKVILAASIIAVDYPWAEMLGESRATWVVNDYAGRDIWPQIAGLIVRNAGNSGTRGFTDIHRALVQVSHPLHKHSDYFSLGNFRHNWIPTLLLNKRKIVDNLHALIGILAGKLQINRGNLRCFVLAEDPDNGCLKVVPGLHVGTIAERELRFSIALDAIGVEAVPAVAFRQMREVWQGEKELSALKASIGAASAINREVKWSTSLPVPYGIDTKRAIGVLIIDGLQESTSASLANELSSEENVYEVVSRLGVALFEARPR